MTIQGVVCVVCRTAVPIHQADLVGIGYRCAPCGVRAQFAGNSGLPVTAATRARLLAGAFRMRLLGGVLVALSVLIAIWAADQSQ